MIYTPPLNMDQYGKVKSGSLKLKGEKKHKKHKKSKKREHSGERGDVDDAKKRRREMKEDCERHGGWWAAEKIFEVAGPVAIQFPNSCYVKAMDNGKFVLGPPHGDGEPPAPEEVLMALRSGDGKISLKSGFDKYLRIDKAGYLLGVSDAVGGLELFEPIWEEGKCALLGANGKFLTADDDDMLLCSQHSVGPMEVIRIRSNKEREDVNKKSENPDEAGSAAEIELRFTKKFLKYQDKKYRARFDYDSQSQIMTAKSEGRLHEALLDRREKMKSDRMCK